MKKLIVIVGSLVLLLMAASLLLPSMVTVSRSENIAANNEKISMLLGNFSQWNSWYPPLSGHRLTLQDFSNDSSEVTLVHPDGRRLQMIRTTSDTNRVVIQFDAGSDTKLTYDFLWRTIPPGKIQLILSIHTQLGWYPWERAKGLFVEKIMGPQTDEMIRQIKAVAEE